LVNAKPPALSGVYAIRVVRGEKPTSKILGEVTPFFQELTSRWEKYGWLCGQVRLIEQIGECNLIYIGRAGSLCGRYDQLSWGHPAGWPVAALLYFGWELEYGWIEEAVPRNKEKEMKGVYKDRHDGKLPALMRQ